MAPSSRSGIHRLPESIAGGLAFNRPLGPNDRAGSYHPPPGILRRTPSQPAEHVLSRPSPTRALFEPRPIVRPSQWSGTPGPAAPGVQFDPRLLPPLPESLAGSYGTSHSSFSGGRGPVIKPSIEYAGEADIDLYESFVFDLQRVFRTYPPNVSEATKVSVLGGQLTGKARIFFNSKDYYYSDWQTVCEELQVRYLPLVAPELTWNKFWNVQQWDDEKKIERPIHEVIQELEAHQLRLGPSCNGEIMRMRLLGAFSDRMNDAMVQVRVNTWDELRENALQTDQRRRQNLQRRAERSEKGAKTSVPDRSATDSKKKRLYTASQVLTASSSVRPAPSGGTRPFRTAATTNQGAMLTADQLAHHLRNNLCFGCSGSGHSKAECPKGKKASSNHSRLIDDGDDSESEEDDEAEAHGVSLLSKLGMEPMERSGPRALPLKLMIRIGGKLAYTLVDDGCTHNLIRPSFIKLHDLPFHKYKDPLTIKQTTVGSKGSINHWAQLDTQSPRGEVRSSEVFQLVALDRYDAFVSVDWIKRNLLVHRDNFAVWANGEIQLGEGPFDQQEARTVAERYARALTGEFLPAPEVLASSVLAPGFSRDDSDLVVTSSLVPISIRQQLTALLDEYSDVFQDGASDELPPLRTDMNHRIPLVDATLVNNTRLYKMPDAFLTQFYALAEKHLKSGTWARGVANGAASIMARPKPADASKARFVSDLRQRNANTVKDQYAPPDQTAIRNAVCRTIQRDGGICTALDFPDGYHQVRVDPDDVPKTATRTPIGVILWLVMQQGDTNAGATFQRNMDVSFEGGEQLGVRAYMDNLYVHTKVEDHVEVLRWVLSRLRKYQWKVSFAKAEVARDDLEVLGFRVNANGVHVDERKVWDITRHPEPKDIKQMQSFLGMVNYLSDRMPEVALLTAPLSEIATQGARFLMTPMRQEAFRQVKALVSRTVALSPISAALAKSDDPSGRVWVVADASVSGVGGWVGQGELHDSMRPAGFFSKKYNSAQANWATPDQEFLALVATLSAFRGQLLGVPLTLVTDSKTASRLRDKAELKGKSWRWDDFLSEFIVRDIVHVPRTRNSLSDYLSKLALEYPEAFTTVADEVCDPCRGEDEDGRLSVQGDRPAIVESQAVEGEDQSPPPGWSSAYASDRSFADVVAHPERYTTLYRWDADAGMLYAIRSGEPELLVVPKQKRDEILRQSHVGVGHQGVRYTVFAIRRHYWWPNLVRDVTDFCAECDSCQRSKSSSQSAAGFIRSLTIARGAWKHVAIDFVGPFPAGKSKNNFLMVSIDRASTQVRLAACKTSLTGEEAADLYLRTVYVLHGWPLSVVSDRDPRFTGAFWQGLMRGTGVDLKMSTAAHPETDGQAEAANKTVVQILRCLLLEKKLPHADWEQLLPHVEFAMNSSLNRSLGMSPFDYIYGETPSALPSVTKPLQPVSASDFATRVAFLRDWAWDGVMAARTNQTRDANRSRRDDPTYAIGDRVMLSTTNLRLREDKKRPWAGKLLPKWVGPFAVIKESSPTYRLELPTWLRVHPTFHTRLLKPWKGADGGSVEVPKHDAFDSDLTPVAVVDYRDVGVGIGSRREFLVQWRGNVDAVAADTWEDAVNVVDHFPDLPANITEGPRTRSSTRRSAL
ncbi:hypothetical protein CF319_g8343 [Tilletia indica]|nr:hypothetical protein CF319_g8343 [Tilletia indica]